MNEEVEKNNEVDAVALYDEFCDEMDSVYDEFVKQHPDFPQPRLIDRLDLVMRKAMAKEIVDGKKKVEYRRATPHYVKRLEDQESIAWLNRLDTPAPDIAQLYLRMVDILHFHNYNNSWTLDVECEGVFILPLDINSGIFVKEVYGDDEYLKEAQALEAEGVKEEDRPWFYVFALGEIVNSHNL